MKKLKGWDKVREGVGNTVRLRTAAKTVQVDFKHNPRSETNRGEGCGNLKRCQVNML